MKSFLAFILIVTSVSAFAQQRRGDEGRITTRDGRTTLRINIGNDRNSDVHLRIRSLEEAVRDLQDQVYDLREADIRTRIVTTHVCSLTTSFDGTFLGKASTKTEAEAIARSKCNQARVSFCSSTRVNCEQVQEEVRF